MSANSLRRFCLSRRATAISLIVTRAELLTELAVWQVRPLVIGAHDEAALESVAQ